MMYRGGGIGGCWADFCPAHRGFLKPRPLSSRSTLYRSPRLSSAVRSRFAVSPALLLLFLLLSVTTLTPPLFKHPRSGRLIA